MAVDFRPLAIATAGFTAFVNLYSPQALLPELSHEFGVGAGEISALITASSAAIALTAPFTGALADVIGRKRLITAAAFVIVVPTLMMAWAWTVPQLVVLRFVQGLLLPPIFTVAVAYVGDEWPPADVARITGLFVSGSSVGGFCGRFATGVVADLLGWRASFGAVALITLAGAIIVTIALPRERQFVRSVGFAASAKQMIAHLRNPRLLAIYAVGFGVLFNFIATFTYVSFHLAAAPYFFTPTLLGALFATYLAGSFTVPWVGRAVVLVRPPPLRTRRHRAVDRRCPAAAGAAGARDHRGAHDLRRLWDAVPGDIDRLCDHDGQGRTFLGGRSLCLVLLCRRQRRRVSDRLRLERRRLDRLRRRHRRGAGGHGGDRRHSLGSLADLAAPSSGHYRLSRFDICLTSRGGDGAALTGATKPPAATSASASRSSVSSCL